MQNRPTVPAPSTALAAALLLVGAANQADAGLYTVDYIGNSLFAITSMNGNATDKERHQRFLTNFDHTVPMNDTFFADSFFGTGSASATANVQLAMTSTTIQWHGSIDVSAVLGDAIIAHTQAESALDMLFTVAQPTLFTYSGSASLTLDPVGPPISGVSQMIWTSGGSGTLNPGQYRVMGQVKLAYEIGPVFQYPSVHSTGRFDIEMTFAPVPAPGAGLLLCFGGVVLTPGRR